jgi:phosphoenolpyruvate carboxykinase (ATP)
MSESLGTPSKHGLENHGLKNLNTVYWTMPRAKLIALAVERGEGKFADSGGFVTLTGEHTGRSANDKFIVDEGEATKDVDWGKVNVSIDPAKFESLYQRMLQYYEGKDVFVQDVLAGKHKDYELAVRVVTVQAWHSLFARNMFVTRPNEELADHVPEFTVLQAPKFLADPAEDGTNSGTFIMVSFERKLVLIGGTSYAGEIKKSIFSVLNYMLPKKGVLGMHCSANIGKQADAALFFGLSGTGKTTLSSDPDRLIVGDDEHGWGDDGVFNFEGGSYAKVIRLSKKYEPLIYDASRKFGAILENVRIDEDTHTIDYDDATYTQNTRASYPLSFLPNSVPEGRSRHPNHIFFLTADAFGVLPPISKLSTEQAMYYFLSGYTAKLAGTEKGLGNEPQATFSACFGAPFLPLHPNRYAELLGEKIQKHKADVWLINTGWTGGPFGVGERINLPFTRAMISAALNGELSDVPTREDDFFGLSVPLKVSKVPDQVLDPRATWMDGLAYDEQAQKLVKSFQENFEQYADQVSKEILAAGPKGANAK